MKLGITSEEMFADQAAFAESGNSDSWLDTLATIGTKYLDYRTQSDRVKSQTAIAQAQAQSPYRYTSSGYGVAPVIPSAPVSDNTTLYLGLAGVGILAILLLGDRK